MLLEVGLLCAILVLEVTVILRVWMLFFAYIFLTLDILLSIVKTPNAPDWLSIVPILALILGLGLNLYYLYSRRKTKPADEKQALQIEPKITIKLFLILITISCFTSLVLHMFADGHFGYKFNQQQFSISTLLYLTLLLIARLAAPWIRKINFRLI